MPKPLQWLMSLIFIVQMYLVMALAAVVFALPALLSRNMAFAGVHFYCNWVRRSAALLVGLRSEIRGPVPQTEVLIAAKHQSFFDIILLCSVLPRPKFIMKRELIWAPFLGQYALRMGCIPVDRGKRGSAIAKMKSDVARGTAQPGQLVIYPQGTRVAPGEVKSYKMGTGLLYEQLGQTCIPAATNVGLFWPKRGILRLPGLAVMQFLPPIPPGKPVPAFMADMQQAVETASDALMREAGWTGP
ncbi:MAG: 1-acyl-sn-glycerol-3-phosphate acyltransferase [Candidatus Saccharibacteria bacterium]|nr:1-acyl-sn-glycerol-3-phosphate acyltransferase [Pseudorhodobacter sp.]